MKKTVWISTAIICIALACSKNEDNNGGSYNNNSGILNLMILPI